MTSRTKETSTHMIVFVVGRVLRLRRNTHRHQYASFDSLLSRSGLGHCSFVVTPPEEDYLTGLTALLPKLEQVVQIYSSSVAV